MSRLWLGSGWKMNKTLTEAHLFAKSLKDYISGKELDLNLFVVPPFTALHTVYEVLSDTPVKIGAQNMYWEDSGSFTGEISPVMIKESGATIVELGHSERRILFGETDEQVNQKVLSAIRHGLQPLICLGETKSEKESNLAEKTVVRQISLALKNVPANAIPSIMIAYEPVWSIGNNGTAASPEYANKIHSLIRASIGRLYNVAMAENIPILYGGSVNLQNAVSYIEQPGIDGLFIGRASWEVSSFIQILKAVENSQS